MSNRREGFIKNGHRIKTRVSFAQQVHYEKLLKQVLREVKDAQPTAMSVIHIQTYILNMHGQTK